MASGRTLIAETLFRSQVSQRMIYGGQSGGDIFTWTWQHLLGKTGGEKKRYIRVFLAHSTLQTGDTARLIFNFGSRGWVSGQLHAPAALPPIKEPDKKPGEHHSPRGRFGKNILPLSGNESRPLGRPLHSPVTIPTELPRLQVRQKTMNKPKHDSLPPC